MEKIGFETSASLKEVQLNSIKQLALKYNINLVGNTETLSWNTQGMHEKYNTPFDEIHLNRLRGFSFSHRVEQKPNSLNILDCKKSLAELDILLRNVVKNQTDITVSTTIKSIKSSVVLDSGISYELLLYVDSLIEALSDGYYQFLFDWEFKEEMKKSLVSELTEPYTDEEIAKIIEHETNSAISRKNHNKKLLSIKIKKITEYLREEGVFSLDYETISTSEACFLFDTLVLLGVIGKDDTYNNQEKYQFIKSKLK